jgi:carboxymethylenebutenolidase
MEAAHGRLHDHHGPRRARVSGLAGRSPTATRRAGCYPGVFGVNSHIRAVADGFAAEGYTVIAPSLFDRIRRGIQLGYTAADLQEGVGYRSQLTPRQP